MNYSFHVHYDEGLDYLLEYSQNLLHWYVFLLFVVVKKVAFRAVFHGDLQQFVRFIELWFVYLNKVRMDKFFHDFNLLKGLLDFERVYMNFLKSVAAILGIFDQVHWAKASLSNEIDHFVFCFHVLSFFMVLAMIRRFLWRWCVIEEMEVEESL